VISLFKFIHLTAISLWAAGLIGLPFLILRYRRLAADDDGDRQHRLVRFVSVGITSPAAFISVASGVVLIFLQATFDPWFAVKLALVGAMVGFHLWMGFAVLGLSHPPSPFGPVSAAILAGGATLVVAAILWVVLAKPAIEADLFPDGFFEPGALSEWASDFLPGNLAEFLENQGFSDPTMPTP